MKTTEKTRVNSLTYEGGGGTGGSGITPYSGFGGFTPWTDPFKVDVTEKENSIEIVYKQTQEVWAGTQSTANSRVFKVIFSCKDGRWHKSERIYGEIIEQAGERYVFPD